MGEFEMIRISTGERTVFAIDGTIIKDQIEPPKVEWCDRCECFKSAIGGRYDGADGLAQLWTCGECK
jgi:hypothetical protein